MMMTVDEAHAHRCWRSMGGDPNWQLESCLANRCMAWRWFDSLNDDGTACHMKPTAHVKRHPDNNPAESRPLTERRGYCGLAGKPD